MQRVGMVRRMRKEQGLHARSMQAVVRVVYSIRRRSRTVPKLARHMHGVGRSWKQTGGQSMPRALEFDQGRQRDYRRLCRRDVPGRLQDLRRPPGRPRPRPRHRSPTELPRHGIRQGALQPPERQGRGDPFVRRFHRGREGQGGLQDVPPELRPLRPQLGLSGALGPPRHEVRVRRRLPDVRKPCGGQRHRRGPAAVGDRPQGIPPEERCQENDRGNGVVRQQNGNGTDDPADRG
mmetsp:Transcript_12/g.31  ORF Transcript_12/g.31 Transcript_12/m.31 type:complete len:235 (+) Transcript_12:253-957(+)